MESNEKSESYEKDSEEYKSLGDSNVLGSFEVVGDISLEVKDSMASKVSGPQYHTRMQEAFDGVAKECEKMMELLKKMVKVTNVPEELLSDLRFRLETKKWGGGDIKEEVYSKEERVAIFIFEDADVAAGVLEQGECSIMNHVLHFEMAEIMDYRSMNGNDRQEKSEASQRDESKSPDESGAFGDFEIPGGSGRPDDKEIKKRKRSLIIDSFVSDVSESRLEDVRQDFFAKRSATDLDGGDGILGSVSMISVESSEAEQTLSSAPDGTRLDATVERGNSAAVGDDDDDAPRPPAATESERSVVVYGWPNEESLQDLIDILEHKRHGGGKISRVEPYDPLRKKVVVVFEDARVAEGFVEKRSKKFYGYELFICSFKEEMEMNRTIVIKPVEREECAEDLISALSSSKRGGGAIEKHDFSSDERELTVRFSLRSVAEHFKETRRLKIFGKEFAIRGASHRIPGDDSHGSSVFVGGIPEGTFEDVLTHLGSPRVGGDIKNYRVIDQNTMEVTFSEAAAAGKLLLKKSTTLFSRTLPVAGSLLEVNEAVRKLRSEDDGKNPASSNKQRRRRFRKKKVARISSPSSEGVCSVGTTSQNSTDCSATSKATFGNMRTLVVERLSSRVSEGILKRYFGGKVSGGGECHVVAYDQVERRAVVEYADPQVAYKVSERNHDIDGVVTTYLLEENPAGFRSHALLVGGALESDREHLFYYFENPRIGGGRVKELDLLVNGVFCVVFENPDKIDDLLSRKHSLSDRPIRLEVLQSQPPPRHFKDSEVDKILLLFGNVVKSDVGHFVKTVEQAGKAKVKELLEGKKLMLLKFCSTPDYFSVRKNLACFPIKGRMMSVSRVPYTKQIQLALPLESDLDLVKSRILLAVSENCDARLEMNPDNGLTVATFTDHKNAVQVLSSGIIIGDRKIAAKPFYKELEVDALRPLVPTFAKISYPGEVLDYINSHEEVRRGIEDELKSSFPVKVSWQTTSCDEITLELNSGGADVDHSWRKDAVARLESLLRMFYWREKKCSPEHWDKVKLEVVDYFVKGNSRDLVVKYVEVSRSVLFIGKESSCSALEEHLCEVVKKLLAKEEKIIVSMDTLRAEHLAMINKMDDIMSNGRGVNVSIADGTLSLAGASGMVNELKLLILERVTGLVTEELDLPENISNFLKKVAVKDIFDRNLKDKGLLVSVFDYCGRASLIGCDEDSFVEAAELIKSSVAEGCIEVTPGQSRLLRLESWNKFSTDLQETLHVNLKVVESAKNESRPLTYVCLKDFEDSLKNKVEGFFKENHVCQTFVDMQADFLDAVSTFFGGDVKGVQQSLEKQGGSISQINSKERTGFLLTGKEKDLEMHVGKIKSLKDKITVRKFTLEKPDVFGFFNKSSMGNVLTGIKNMHKVLIKTRPKEMSSSSAGEKFFEIPIDEGRSIVLASGDVKAIKVDTIVDVVCPGADGNVRTSQATFALGGAAHIINESDSATSEDKNKIYISDEVKNLPCSRLLHLEVNKWSAENDKELNIFSAALMRALKETDDDKLLSVALPGGQWEVSEDEMARAVICTLEAFFGRTSGKIEKVYVVVREPETMDLCRALLLDWKERVMGKVDDAEEVEEVAEEGGRHSERFEFVEFSELVQTERVAREEDRDPFVVSSKIEILVDSIVNVKADAIVNSASKDLNLSKGQVSKLLLSAAGSGLQGECLQNRPSNFTYGDVVSTKGYDLKCSSVYHTSCLQWGTQDRRSEMCIRKIMQVALSMASAASYNTIAFPALGTGNLKCPPDQVANIMFEESSAFFQKNKSTSVQKVYFVLYKKDLPTVRAFQECWKTFTTVQVVDDDDDDDDDDSAVNVGHSSVDDDGILGDGDDDSSQPEIDVSDPRKFNVGKLRVEVIDGDITSLHVDAIVNSTNKDLDLSVGAVSQAILRKGGHSLDSELKSAKMKPNGVCITKAGNLPANHIVHVVAQNSFPEWAPAIEAVLREADSCGFSSIAFPVLGSGSFKQSAEEMALLMISCFKKFSVCPENKNLKKIYICIFLKKISHQFIEGVKKVNSSRGVISKFFKLLSSTKEKIGGYFYSRETTKVEEEKKGKKKEEVSRANIDCSVVTVSICGCTSESVQAAADLLMDSVNKAFVDRTFASDKDKELIGKMSKNQVSKLKGKVLQEKCSIKMEADEITISGFADNIFKAEAAVHCIFKEVETSEKERITAEIVKNQISWEYKDGNGFQPYPATLNLLLEKAYRENKMGFTWKEGGAAFTINFDEMIERCVGKNPAEVRRVKAGTSLPENWSVVPSSKKYTIFALSLLDAEAVAVMNFFKASVANLCKTIHKVERIQNPTLHKLYQTRKAAMEKSLPSGTQAEKTLWHGTSADVVHNINEGGFNRSYCGKNATVYGRGVYFARDSSYSAHPVYSPPDGNGVKHVYQCKVLVGEYAAGSQSYIVPPNKPGSTDGYNSVVDRVDRPGIFVVFYDNQAYPEYLISFS